MAECREADTYKVKMLNIPARLQQKTARGAALGAVTAQEDQEIDAGSGASGRGKGPGALRGSPLVTEVKRKRVMLQTRAKALPGKPNPKAQRNLPIRTLVS